MRLDEMIIVLSRVRFLLLHTRIKTVGNQLAKTLLFTWSRATTYRKLKKMVDMGLLESVEKSTGIEYFLTEKGEYFWSKYNELPF
jgi:predicted transcriptional regulator